MGLQESAPYIPRAKFAACVHSVSGLVLDSEIRAKGISSKLVSQTTRTPATQRRSSRMNPGSTNGMPHCASGPLPALRSLSKMSAPGSQSVACAAHDDLTTRCRILTVSSCLSWGSSSSLLSGDSRRLSPASCSAMRRHSRIVAALAVAVMRSTGCRTTSGRRSESCRRCCRSGSSS
jgi:hypothetical protein